jgi:hypothetical protein
MLKDLDNHTRLNMLKIIKDRKQLISDLGGCPAESERVNPQCFYCDDCWIRAIEKSLQN